MSDNTPNFDGEEYLTVQLAELNPINGHKRPCFCLQCQELIEPNDDVELDATVEYEEPDPLADGMEHQNAFRLEPDWDFEVNEIDEEFPMWNL